MLDQVQKSNEELNAADKKLEVSDKALKASNKKLEDKTNELRATTEELETTKSELKATKSALETAQKELNAAQKEWEITDEKLEATKNELEAAHRELETLRKDVESTSSQLKASNKELKAAQQTINKQKKAKQTVPTSTYSFRLDIYPRSEDTFQSRIEHLLSGDRESLDGLDINTIVEFIRLYLPEESKLQAAPDKSILESTTRVDAQELTNETEPASPPPFKGIAEQRLEEQPAPAILLEPRLHTQPIPEGGIFQKYSPFQLELKIDPGTVQQAQLTGIRCKASIFARSLDTGTTSLLGVLDENLGSLDETTTHTINAIGLPEGLYRLDTVTSFTAANKEPLPISSISEGSFIQII